MPVWIALIALITATSVVAFALAVALLPGLRRRWWPLESSSPGWRWGGVLLAIGPMVATTLRILISP